MQGLKFGHIAIIFGVCGIALLYVVTVFSQPLHLDDFSQLSEYEGEIVTVEGAVISSYLTNNGELYFTLYNNRESLSVVLEDDQRLYDDIKINSLISATGEVYRNYRGDLELSVTDNNAIEVIGHYDPPELDQNHTASFNNSYIHTKGTIIDLNDYYGEKLKITICNGSYKTTAVILEPTMDLSIGDSIDVFGMIRNSGSEYRLYIMSPRALTITGHWEIESIGLEEFSQEPSRYLDFPINVQGFVRYEPSSVPAYSFYICDRNIDPQITIRVDCSELAEPGELHKGDTVALLGYATYDPARAQFGILPLSLSVLDRYGQWDVTLLALMENTYEYERARVNLTGYLHYFNDAYLMGDSAVLDNCTITLPLEFISDNSRSLAFNRTELINTSILSSTEEPFEQFVSKKIAVEGSLVYCDERFYYSYLFEPNLTYFFPYFE